MKRLFLTAAAALTLAGPLAATPAFADNANSGWREAQYNGRDWRDDRRDDRRDWRDDRRDDRRDWRDDRRDNRRWDNRRDNGYYWNNRFYRGAPPAAYYGRPGFYPGYRAWVRGERIPRGYHYTVVDYRPYRLAPPPRGYHYVRDDRGDILLAAIATGIIASVILNN